MLHRMKKRKSVTLTAAPSSLIAITIYANVAQAMNPSCEPWYWCVRQPPGIDGPNLPHEREPLRLVQIEAVTSAPSSMSIAALREVFR